MYARNLGLCALFCASLGCTQTLDFDSVSNGANAPENGGPKEGPYCSRLDPKPTICQDFDTEPLGGLGFQVVQTNGTATKDKSQALSAPESCLMTSNGGTSLTRIALTRSFDDFANKPVKLIVNFDVKLQQVDDTSEARITVFQLLMGPTNDTNQVVLQFLSNADTVAGRVVENTLSTPGEDGYRAHNLTRTINIDEWTNVRVELDILRPTEAQDNKVRVFINNEDALNTNLELVMKGATPRTELGITDVERSLAQVLPWVLRFDNYSINFQALTE